MFRSTIVMTCVLLLPVGGDPLEAADDLGDALTALRSVGEGSQGSASARDALKTITAGGPENLLPTLQAFRGASPLATNWLRNAFETLANNIRRSHMKLPETTLVEFIQDTEQSPVARRLAFERLEKQNSSIREQLIPEMLLDPSPEFRRDAVAMLMDAASDAESPEQGKMLYRRALKGAVHQDQVSAIAKKLRSGGDDVNIQEHFGFLTNWQIIGPFDNKDEAGYAVAYPPESDADPKAIFTGQEGDVRWAPISTDDDFGVIDITKQIHNYKGSLMYAVTTFESDSAADVQIRLGTPNAWKLWVNDELVFEREEYHRSTQMDQYTIPVHLKPGPNRILVKVCQNEMTQDWAQRYQFQLRVCDNTGAGISPEL